jgi:hypothetical protein
LVKDNGSVWLRWLLKQGGVIQAHTNHSDSRVCLEFSFARHDIFHPSKEPTRLLTSQREKRQMDSPVLVT